MFRNLAPAGLWPHTDAMNGSEPAPSASDFEAAARRALARMPAEFAEKLHLKLVEKKLIRSKTFHRGVRTVFYVIFALLALSLYWRGRSVRATAAVRPGAAAGRR